MSMIKDVERERFANMLPIGRLWVRSAYRRCRRMGMGMNAARSTVEMCMIAGSMAASARYQRDTNVEGGDPT